MNYDNHSDRNKIINKIFKGNLEEAIKLMMDYFSARNTDQYIESVLLGMRLSLLRINVLKGRIDLSGETIEKTRIASNMLDLVKDFDD